MMQEGENAGNLFPPIPSQNKLKSLSHLSANVFNYDSSKILSYGKKWSQKLGIGRDRKG